MKLNGKAIVRDVREVVVPRSDGTEIRFTVSSITIGIKRDFDRIYPRVQPPLIVTTSKAGGREEREDTRDSKYIEALFERQALQNIYLLYRVLEHDPNVQFDTAPTDIASLRTLDEEIRSTGLSEGDIIVILKEALKASNLTTAEIEAAKANF